jgi:hypothetical protein
MLMPSARQTKRIMEKSSLLTGICKVFGLIRGHSSRRALVVHALSTSCVGALK